MLRPNVGRVVLAPDRSRNVTVLNGPKPWPTALIAATANPARARAGATAVGPPNRLSPNPWPKITTGYPAAGFGVAGSRALKPISSVLSGMLRSGSVG